MKGRSGWLAVLGRLWTWALAALVAGMWTYGRIDARFTFGLRAGESLRDFLVEMALVLPPMFVLVGLFEVWVPRGLVERRVGRSAGIAAIPWMVLLATVQAGPLYGAFPVAVSLWRKGCAPRNVFVYLGAFSAMKLPMLTFEVAFLGWNFSLARTLITLPVFIGIALAMERLLPSGYVLPRSEEPQEMAERAHASGPNAPPLLAVAPGRAVRVTPKAEAMLTNRQTSFSKNYREKGVPGVPASKVPADVVEPLVAKVVGSPEEMLLTVGARFTHDLEHRPRSFSSLVCEGCGEMVIEGHARMVGDKKVCLPCQARMSGAKE